jgi:DnaJ-class molecular chaperone
MPTTVKCTQCNGNGQFVALVSMHDTKTEKVICSKCNGEGVIHQMTDVEESDYHSDYW